MHCYFLLYIKHGASQLYRGRPPNTTLRSMGRELSGAPGGLPTL